MVPAMRVCGRIMYLTVEEFLFNLMEDDTKANLKTEKAMAMGGIYQEIKRSYMKGNFKMINRMVLVLKLK